MFRDIDVHAPLRDLTGRILVLAAASIGVWLVVRLTRIGLASLRGGAGRAVLTSHPDRARERTAEEWESLAREARTAERWREASMALYHAVILRLAEAGHLRPSPAKTPGDYRREAGSSSRTPDAADLAARIAAFLQMFERLVFAPTHPRADDYDRLRALAEPMGAHG